MARSNAPSEPEIGEIRLIELCSGEVRRWQYLGADGRSIVWWRDMDSAREFSESSLMYAWRILDDLPEAP